MSFISYLDYLQSNLWSEIRSRVLTRSNRRCCKCGGRATEVHHSSYARSVLAGQDDSKLYPVCSTCHESAEMTKVGKKRRLSEANDILLKSQAPKSVIATRLCKCGKPMGKNKLVCNQCRSQARRERRAAQQIHGEQCTVCSSCLKNQDGSCKACSRRTSRDHSRYKHLGNKLFKPAKRKEPERRVAALTTVVEGRRRSFYVS